ncbi:hypothetical protein C8R44DRAFT_798145 [Mycena epipterygia]|nr:hypothetical protein C8R44DRAFT_798145 [Mycena epipterygia]
MGFCWRSSNRACRLVLISAGLLLSGGSMERVRSNCTIRMVGRRGRVGRGDSALSTSPLWTRTIFLTLLLRPCRGA